MNTAMRTRIARRSITTLSLAVLGATPACYAAPAARALRYESTRGTGVADSGAQTWRVDSGAPVLHVTSEQSSVSVDARNADQVASSLRAVVGNRVAGVSVERVSGIAYLRLNGHDAAEHRSGQLFVIDGVPLAEEFALTIPALNVARVDLMTDSVATGPYGQRGKGGVVLVTLRAK